MIEDRPEDIDQVVPRAMPRESARYLLGRMAPNQAQDIWDQFLKPLYDLRGYQQQWPGGSCRHCWIPHPQSRNGQIRRVQERTWTHRMQCPRYVGALEHRIIRLTDSFFGTPRVECACGKAYNEYVDDELSVKSECPDILVLWRGPRPDTERTESQESRMSEQDETKSNQQVQDDLGVRSDSQAAVEAEQKRLEELHRNGQVGSPEGDQDDRQDEDDEQGREGQTFHQ